MESDEYRKVHKETKFIGDLPLLFEGEQWKGTPEILDTKVSINGEMLCWITWKDKEDFTKKLNDIIGEHRI